MLAGPELSFNTIATVLGRISLLLIIATGLWVAGRKFVRMVWGDVQAAIFAIDDFAVQRRRRMKSKARAPAAPPLNEQRSLARRRRGRVEESPAAPALASAQDA